MQRACSHDSICRLGTNIEYRTISHLFGVGLSGVLLDMQSMRQLSLTTLGHRCIRIPQRNDMQKVVDGFMGRWQFLQCAGALDITHIPAENHTDYFNCKGLHSVVM